MGLKPTAEGYVTKESVTSSLETISEKNLKILKKEVSLISLLFERESYTIECEIERGPKKPTYIDTKISLLDKLLNTFAYYARLNITLKIEFKQKNKSMKNIFEDVGWVLGKAISMLGENIKKIDGIKGYGAGHGIIEESFTSVGVVINNKPKLIFYRDPRVKIFGKIGDISEENLKIFFNEFVKGLGATLHIDMMKGEDGYNSWSSVFMALGDAINQTLIKDEWLKE
ncbi:MAG: hypothetical protein QW118_00415 [Nitrososphaerota archaeon]